MAVSTEDPRKVISAPKNIVKKVESEEGAPKQGSWLKQWSKPEKVQLLIDLAYTDRYTVYVDRKPFYFIQDLTDHFLKMLSELDYDLPEWDHVLQLYDFILSALCHYDYIDEGTTMSGFKFIGDVPNYITELIKQSYYVFQLIPKVLNCFHDALSLEQRQHLAKLLYQKILENPYRSDGSKYGRCLYGLNVTTKIHMARQVIAQLKEYANKGESKLTFELLEQEIVPRANLLGVDEKIINSALQESQLQTKKSSAGRSEELSPTLPPMNFLASPVEETKKEKVISAPKNIAKTVESEEGASEQGSWLKQLSKQEKLQFADKLMDLAYTGRYAVYVERKPFYFIEDLTDHFLKMLGELDYDLPEWDHVLQLYDFILSALCHYDYIEEGTKMSSFKFIGDVPNYITELIKQSYYVFQLLPKVLNCFHDALSLEQRQHLAKLLYQKILENPYRSDGSKYGRCLYGLNVTTKIHMARQVIAQLKEYANKGESKLTFELLEQEIVPRANLLGVDEKIINSALQESQLQTKKSSARRSGELSPTLPPVNFLASPVEEAKEEGEADFPVLKQAKVLPTILKFAQFFQLYFLRNQEVEEFLKSNEKARLAVKGLEAYLPRGDDPRFNKTNSKQRLLRTQFVAYFTEVEAEKDEALKQLQLALEKPEYRSALCGIQGSLNEICSYEFQSSWNNFIQGKNLPVISSHYSEAAKKIEQRQQEIQEIYDSLHQLQEAGCQFLEEEKKTRVFMKGKELTSFAQRTARTLVDYAKQPITLEKQKELLGTQMTQEATHLLHHKNIERKHRNVLMRLLNALHLFRGKTSTEKSLEKLEGQVVRSMGVCYAVNV